MNRSLLILICIFLVSCEMKKRPGATAQLIPAPAPYAGQVMPMAADPIRGAKLFRDNCASCHGATGRGDGPAARAFRPVPADISRSHYPDDYLFWRISEGGVGEPFHSAMPPWKSALTEADRWALIAHLRQLGAPR